jgi:ABC-type uncharacterized transport system permease subunit
MKWRVLALACVSLLLLAGAVHLANVSPMEALRVLLKGSFGSPKAFAGTLKETTPLLIAGLAVFFALKAGLFNIGVEGQFLMGALGATVVGLAAGVLCGLLWALPAALIKAYKNGHEVITTIMLNNVAAALTLALVKGPLRDPGQEGSSTATLDASLWLPSLDFGTPTGRFSVAILAGLALVVAAAIWLKKTVGGYELRATGANPVAAAFAGVKTKSVVVKAMCVSGALGGMAGALHVFASEHRFYDGFSSGYGSTLWVWRCSPVRLLTAYCRRRLGSGRWHRAPLGSRFWGFRRA